MNPILRAWSQGSVGDKTFQQISEEFAELIIPKVWEREGRKDFTCGGAPFRITEESPADPEPSGTAKAAGSANGKGTH